MPRFARKKKNPVRKARKYKRRYKRMGVPSGMPSSRKTTLRFCDTVTLTTTAGTLLEYLYRANDIYKPWQSATSHRPMGFDQWVASFNQWVVVSSRMTVKLVDVNTTNNPCYIGTYVTDGTIVPYTTAASMIESKRGMSVLRNSVDDTTYLRNKFYAKPFFNISDIKDNDQLYGTATTSPPEQAYYMIWIQSADASNASFYAQVVIDYDVVFTEPKDILAST